MRVINTLRQFRFATVAVVLVIAGIISIGFWRAIAVHEEQVFASKHSIHESVRRGLAREVTFAAPGDSKGRILASVESVDKFIHGRSNLRMSQETKDRLIGMEQATLDGTSARIQPEELSASLADTLTERLATLSDPEIEFAEKTLQRDGTALTLRRGGGNAATRQEFTNTARALREQSQRGDKAARDTVLGAINSEVNDRLDLFAGAMPEQFSNARTNGVTPLQAVLITYSIAADDDLSGSQQDLKEAAFASRAGDRKAFGVDGYVFRTPTNLMFNKKTTARLLDHFGRRAGK